MRFGVGKRKKERSHIVHRCVFTGFSLDITLNTEKLGL